MPTVAEHYKTLLADVYSRMLGGFEQGIARNTALFERHAVEGAGFTRIESSIENGLVTLIAVR